MTPRTKSLDTKAQQLAGLAKMLARAQGISTEKAWVKVTNDIPRTRGPFVPYDPREPRDPTAGPFVRGETFESFAEWQQSRLNTLRLDLEAVLLRLDACYSTTAIPKDVEPIDKDFEKLNKLIAEATAALRQAGMTMPIRSRVLNRWDHYRKVDRHFPKLRLCKRVTALVTRLCESTPPRPLGVLMRPVGRKNEQLTNAFFTLLVEIRRGLRDPATVNWLEYEPLLLRSQNAELQKAGKTPRTVLRRKPGTPTGPPAIEAYVALLELELADLRWGRHYARRITPIKDWLRTLNHEALWRKMEPFCAGSLNEVDSGIEINKELEIQWKRKDAAARKAKSRKKLGKKV